MWPQEANVSFGRGVLLIPILFFFQHLFFEGALLIGLDPVASTMGKTLILIGVLALEWILVLGIIRGVGKVSLTKMLWGKLPSWREWLVWGSVAVLLGSIHLLSYLRYGDRFEKMSIGLFLAGIVLQAVMIALIEESIYRGVCFVALRNHGPRSRTLAYVGSSLLFILSHAPSFAELLRHAVLGLNTASIVYIGIFGLIAAYVYESTGKLMLCVWMHTVVNSMDYLGAMIGHLTGFTMPQ